MNSDSRGTTGYTQSFSASRFSGSTIGSNSNKLASSLIFSVEDPVVYSNSTRSINHHHPNYYSNNNRWSAAPFNMPTLGHTFFDESKSNNNNINSNSANYPVVKRPASTNSNNPTPSSQLYSINNINSNNNNNNNNHIINTSKYHQPPQHCLSKLNDSGNIPAANFGYDYEGSNGYLPQISATSSFSSAISRPKPKLPLADNTAGSAAAASTPTPPPVTIQAAGHNVDQSAPNGSAEFPRSSSMRGQSSINDQAAGLQLPPTPGVVNSFRQVLSSSSVATSATTGSISSHQRSVDNDSFFSGTLLYSSRDSLKRNSTASHGDRFINSSDRLSVSGSEHSIQIISNESQLIPRDDTINSTSDAPKTLPIPSATNDNDEWNLDGCLPDREHLIKQISNGGASMQRPRSPEVPIDEMTDSQKRDYLDRVKHRIEFCTEEVKRLTAQLQKDRDLVDLLEFSIRDSAEAPGILTASKTKQQRQYADLFTSSASNVASESQHHHHHHHQTMEEKVATSSDSQSVSGKPFEAEMTADVTASVMEEQAAAEYASEHGEYDERHSEQLICRKWNRGACFKGTHCNYFHECLHCGGPHPRVKCSTAAAADEDYSVSGDNERLHHHSNHQPSSDHPFDPSFDKATADPCIKWNQRDCNWGERCHRMHCCFHCRQNHRLPDCPNNPPSNLLQFSVAKSLATNDASNQRQRSGGLNEANGYDEEEASKENNDRIICVNWNDGRCRMGDRCKRAHRCIQCNSLDHAVAECKRVGEEGSTSEDGQDHHHHQQQQQQHSSASSILLVGQHETCINWNNMRCSSDSCRRTHRCACCGSGEHPAIACPDPRLTASDLVDRGVEICWNWNRGRCAESDYVHPNGARLANFIVGSACKRIHVCSMCKSGLHSLLKCTVRQELGVTVNSATDGSDQGGAEGGQQLLGGKSEICANWNQNRCKLADRCKRLHLCAICRKSDHIASNCVHPQRLTQQQHGGSNQDFSGGPLSSSSSLDSFNEFSAARPTFISADEVCINWNEGRCRLGKRCKRLHVCVQCYGEGHTQRECKS